MQTISFGVIGVGRMGSYHARNLATSVRGARLVALADVAVDRARKLAAELAVAKVFEDFRQLLGDPSVEAVVIAGPAEQRELMLEAAFASKKPVFCEKPLATDLQTARRIKQRALESGCTLQVGFMRRFDPGYARAKQMIEEGAIGQPVVIRATSLDPFLADQEFVASSGGIVMDLCIHDFDLVRFLMGDEVEKIYAVGGVFKYRVLEQYDDQDDVLCVLHFRNGAFGSVQGSRHATYGYDIRTEILGTEGALHVGYLRHTPLLLLQARGVSHDVVPFFKERFRDAYLLELQAFVDALQSGRPVAVGVEDGERAVAIATAARSSLESGRPEPVPE